MRRLMMLKGNGEVGGQMRRTIDAQDLASNLQVELKQPRPVLKRRMLLMLTPTCAAADQL